MPSDGLLSLIIKSDSLGTVGNFDPAVLARIPSKDSLHVAQIFLRETLDEMVKIRHLSEVLREDNADLLQETGEKYSDLMRQTKELQLLEQRSWIYKRFLKRGKLKRARRTFVSDAFELWNSTSTKSDTLKKSYVLTPTADLAAVERGSVPEDHPITGLALDLPKGPITQETVALAQELIAIVAAGNSSARPTPSEIQVGQPSSASAIAEAGALSFTQSGSPSSRSSASSGNIFGPMNINVTVVNNTNSTTSGIAINSANSDSGLFGDHPSSVNNPPNP